MLTHVEIRLGIGIITAIVWLIAWKISRFRGFQILALQEIFLCLNRSIMQLRIVSDTTIWYQLLKYNWSILGLIGAIEVVRPWMQLKGWTLKRLLSGEV